MCFGLDAGAVTIYDNFFGARNSNAAQAARYLPSVYWALDYS
jgi:hypothetical protein